LFRTSIMYAVHSHVGTLEHENASNDTEHSHLLSNPPGSIMHAVHLLSSPLLPFSSLFSSGLIYHLSNSGLSLLTNYRETVCIALTKCQTVQSRLSCIPLRDSIPSNCRRFNILTFTFPSCIFGESLW
jgi:hypothetical protein